MGRINKNTLRSDGCGAIKGRLTLKSKSPAYPESTHHLFRLEATGA